MPAKTAKQYRFMAGIANGMTPTNGAGPSPEVAKEFVSKTPSVDRSKFMKALKKNKKH